MSTFVAHPQLHLTTEWLDRSFKRVDKSQSHCCVWSHTYARPVENGRPSSRKDKSLVNSKGISPGTASVLIKRLTAATLQRITTQFNDFNVLSAAGSTFIFLNLCRLRRNINLVTISILSRKKCGLSKCVTFYLVAMAAADLLVVIFDLILRHIPIVYLKHFLFLKYSIPVCNIHAALLFAATDCSVWFTVTFTFDRFVAICRQKLKTKYCTRKTSAIVLGTVTVLSCLKNISRYFMLSGQYGLRNEPWFCFATTSVLYSQFWTIIEFLHYILTPFVPFLVILVLNVLTVRHIVVSSRAHRRLRAHSSGESSRDSEMESRRKSIILLLVISANFILLWAVLMVYSIWNRMWYLGNGSEYIPVFLQEIGFMLQLLSCCTNTCISAVTQNQFREQLKTVLKYPFSPIIKLIQ
ncbi:probable G-protein coupled receptor 139 [Heterodontus francisci]|uniref:probable G-protein coupled receptor 139 n=1 Tax=Heterodontus francisci TaxID=7792 RepID=UPI00355C32C0